MRDWTYYQHESLSAAVPPVFYRYWRGIAERLDQSTMTWVPVDGAGISRYIELGETMFDTITRGEIEAMIGRPLPA